MIEGGARDEDTGRYVLEINPKLAQVLRPDPVDADRLGSSASTLRGKPLALWLHGFYASHAAPYPLTVAYLHKLSGSQTKQLRYFKKNLLQAPCGISRTPARSRRLKSGTIWSTSGPCRVRASRSHLAARRPPARRRK